MLLGEALLRNFTSLLRQVQCLRASVSVVVATLFVLQEIIVALDCSVDCCDFLILVVTGWLGSDDSAWHVKHEKRFSFFNLYVHVSLQLLLANSFLGKLGSLFLLLSLGLLVLRGLNERAGESTLHGQSGGLLLSGWGRKLAFLRLLLARLRAACGRLIGLGTPTVLIDGLCDKR